MDVLPPDPNLECVHCYADSGPTRPLAEGMELADWLGALDEAAALGCRNVQFIGGEPTMYPGLPRLIERARELRYEDVCVYTNGTHLTAAVKQTFLDHRVSLAFSVYGTSGAVHDAVTRRNGSFEKTSDALHWALEAGLPARVGVIAMESNAEDAERAERMLREAKISVHLDRLRGLGRGFDQRPARSPMKELCGRCGNGKVCVSASGEIFPCVFARFAPLGHIRRRGLRDAFGGPELLRFREALFETLSAAPPCSPELDPGPCTPEKKPGLCNPEKDPGPCIPETGYEPARSRSTFHSDRP
jgi:MoaA/NifB/PqqE/SkfB family radical SAM enzyme